MEILDEFQTIAIGFVKMFFPNIDVLEDFQEEFLTYVGDQMAKKATSINVAIKAGKGVGKTRLMALYSLWAVCCFKSPCIRVISGTKAQSVGVLMREIHMCIQQSLLADLFYCKQTKVSLKKDDGSPCPTQNIRIQVLNSDRYDVIAGDHADFTFYIIDEASLLDYNSYKTLMGIQATGTSSIVMIGNPTRRDSIFYEITTDPSYRESWKIMTVSGYDMKRDNYRLSTLESTYGNKDSDLNKVYIQGLWVDDELGKLYNEASIETLLANIKNPLPLNRTTVIGVDVASGVNADASVVISRTGSVAQLLFYSVSTDTVTLQHFILNLRAPNCTFVVDSSGVGRSLIPFLRRFGINVLELYGGSPALNSGIFGNRKTELFEALKSWVEYENPAFLIKDDGVRRKAYQEFLSIPYDFHNGLKYSGNKKNIRKSPDIIDALSYTFATGYEYNTIGDMYV